MGGCWRRQDLPLCENHNTDNTSPQQSRLLVSHVTLNEYMNGDPPCHARFEDLYRIGFEDAGAVKHRDKAGLNGEIFRDRIIEAITELGPKADGAGTEERRAA